MQGEHQGILILLKTAAISQSIVVSQNYILCSAEGRVNPGIMGISPPERETSFCLESIMISLELSNCLRARGW